MRYARGFRFSLVRGRNKWSYSSCNHVDRHGLQYDFARTFDYRVEHTFTAEEHVLTREQRRSHGAAASIAAR